MSKSASKQLELTLEEANVITDALDITVKTKGLSAATNCLFIFNKLKEVFAEEVEAAAKEVVAKPKPPRREK